MIDQWRRERAQLDKEIHAVRSYIEAFPNPNRFSNARVRLRILLNQMLVQRQKVHAKILKVEDQEKLTEVFKNISGLSEAETAKLMAAMESLERLKV